MKAFGRIPLYVSALFAGQALSTQSTSWVSIYSGRESTFSDSDHARVLAVLESFGIDHKSGLNSQILIPSETRDATQDLVAQAIFNVKPKVSAPKNPNTDNEKDGSLR